MEKLKLQFPEHFFEGEERCDYYISPEMKKVWAVELDLLNEFMSVCDKHGIKYFAGGGTMLGTVRHNGMIPWDDDIDVFMKRSEFEKFVAIARAGEFKKPYFWQDHLTDSSYLGGPGRLQNISTTEFAYGALREKNGIVTDHLGIYIDVFPLDNIPDEELERKGWLTSIQKLARKAWNLRMYNKRHLLQDDKELEWLDFWFNLIGKPNQLFEQYYKMLSKNCEEKTEKCCIYSFYCRDVETRWVYENMDWEECVFMPFEFLKVPVPVNYDKILTHTYGDWHQFVRGTSEHDQRDIGLFFDVEHPYTYYVDSEKGIRKELIKMDL